MAVSASGIELGRAALSPASQIRARMWNFDPAESIDDAFFKRRIAAAVARRGLDPGLRAQSGLRLIHGESDGLPGVIADRYGYAIVLQLNSAGADKWREAIGLALNKASGCRSIYERSDADTRALEGLDRRSGWLTEAADTRLMIDEHGISYEVDIAGGHKTGFYLDQRDNRLLADNLAAGRSVLNCFCYTGGFSLAALAGGASAVLSIDSSEAALALARRNLGRNPQLAADRAEWVQADVFEHLRVLHRAGRKFDFIVLDPPKFAPSAAHARAAMRAYRDINILGFRLLAPGGLLMTYSCSGGVSAELFRKIVASAAVDARADARILRQLHAGADHPVGLGFPEGAYLKGLLCEVS